MNDTIKAVIETLRRLGFEVEATEVRALLDSHMRTIRAFEAAQRESYARGYADAMCKSAADINALSIDAKKWREQVRLNELAIACELRCEG